MYFSNGFVEPGSLSVYTVCGHIVPCIIIRYQALL